MKLRRRVTVLGSIILPLAATMLSFSSGGDERTPSLPMARHADHLLAGGVAPPGGVLRGPNAGDPDSVRSGERLFASMNCEGCHGVGAVGSWAPSLADGRWRYGGRDEEIFDSIFYGRTNGMPAYGGVIGPDGIWMLVNYLKSLPPPNDVMPTQSWIETRPPEMRPEAGAEDTAAPTAKDAQASQASASQGLAALSRKNGCTACHAADQKLVGPAFREVARKYWNQPGAEGRLLASVKNGSVGLWGTVPMPPNTGMSDAELRETVAQILSLQ